MLNKCKCGAKIYAYFNNDGLGECMKCHELYILKEGEWINVSKEEFKSEFRNRLIEKQMSNK